MLAGYPDGLVDEGPAAGPASLVGLGIARENGWTAPSSDEAKPEATADQPDTKTEAAEQADTSRAETETKAEEGRKDG